jgi:hypothetical protein
VGQTKSLNREPPAHATAGVTKQDMLPPCEPGGRHSSSEVADFVLVRSTSAKKKHFDLEIDRGHFLVFEQHFADLQSRVFSLEQCSAPCTVLSRGAEKRRKQKATCVWQKAAII